MSFLRVLYKWYKRHSIAFTDDDEDEPPKARTCGGKAPRKGASSSSPSKGKGKAKSKKARVVDDEPLPADEREYNYKSLIIKWYMSFGISDNI